MLAKVIQSKQYQANKKETNTRRTTTKTVTAVVGSRYAQTSKTAIHLIDSEIFNFKQYY